MCSQLVALHRKDLRRDPTNPVAALPTDQPAAAAKMWATYLAQRVPKIRDKVLRTFAYDYAWTAENADEGNSPGVLGGPFSNPATDKAAKDMTNRETMATYYAHQLCYADTEDGSL